MPLINCPDCGRAVSDVAPACPGCGRPIAHGPARINAPPPVVRRQGGSYEAIGFLTILAGMGLCFASGLLGGLVMAIGFVIFLAGRFM